MKHVRFTRDFEFWPRGAVLQVFKAGEERKVTEAQYEAAAAAGAVELINGEDQEQRTAADEDGGAAGKGPAGDSPRTRAKRS